ncbi:sulfite exporter TauE/SafE family protein [Aliikangiella maris]|uniref:Sulfite exporter TauE/SafE family protein n=2 Tax=Aliikangiella maris TaxID=3162458 RepID=A0ABV2BYU3_9GAMM
MRQRMSIFWCYPVGLIIALIGWSTLISDYQLLGLIREYWQSPLTMVFGSFVAGSTPLGGGAVAFPVFTKALSVDTQQAKIFSLMIQSVGMTFAVVLFVSLKIPIVWRWLLQLLPGSILGLTVGLLFLPVMGSFIKFVFSLFTLITGILLIKIHTGRRISLIDDGEHVPSWIMFGLGFPAGIFSSIVGAGADTILFFVLVILFKHRTKYVIPTTVAYMAMCSLIGVLIIMLSSHVVVTEFVYNSWLLAAPVVALGAPLGGFIMSRFNPNHLFLLISLIILIEGSSTLIFAELEWIEKVILATLIFIDIAYFFSRLRVIKRLSLVATAANNLPIKSP